MSRHIYLDYMSTTPIDNRVIESMIDTIGKYGNPSSTHVYGQEAKELIEDSRIKFAKLVRAKPEEIIFTSCATESINTAIKGVAMFHNRKGKHIVTLKTEHKATLKTTKYLESLGYAITYVDVEKESGILDIEKIIDSIRKDTILISISHVNNEIGTIYPISKVCALASKHGIVSHIDMAQSIGKTDINIKEIGCDFASFSAHKFYGPKGIGILYMNSDSGIYIDPHLHGGGQENNMRSGTYATHQIVGLGKACEILTSDMETDINNVSNMYRILIDSFQKMKYIRINGSLEQRVKNNINISFLDIPIEKLTYLTQQIAVSTGSACSSITSEPSHVLRAIGIPHIIALNSIRISTGRYTTEDEIYKTIEIIDEFHKLFHQ